MGGIKHSMWGMGHGYQGGSQPSKDWMERAGQNPGWYNQQNIVLCKLCGSQIHAVDTDEFENRVDYETELQEEVHGSCRREYMKQQLEEAKRLKEEYERMVAAGEIVEEPVEEPPADPNADPETGLRKGVVPPEGW